MSVNMVDSVSPRSNLERHLNQTRFVFSHHSLTQILTTPCPNTSILFEDWPDPTKRVIDVVADMATVAMTQADDGVLGRGGEGMTLERRRAAMYHGII